MTLSLVFRIQAVVMAFFGLMMLIVPVYMMESFGVESSAMFAGVMQQLSIIVLGSAYVSWKMPTWVGDNIKAVFSPYVATNVVINEINYNSSNDFDPDDWVELYNPTSDNFNLGNWVFKDEANDHNFIIPENTILSAGEYLVLCKESYSFTALFPSVTNFIGDFDFGLSAGGELIRLFDSNGNLVDSVIYDDADPWPAEADGGGPALELISPFLDNSAADNWVASEGFGSPGGVNSNDACGEVLGDINGDAAIDVLDVILMVGIIIILEDDYTICEQYASDINLDGIIDILDIIGLVNIILG
jgi:hypothetical protein